MRILHWGRSGALRTATGSIDVVDLVAGGASKVYEVTHGDQVTFADCPMPAVVAPEGVHARVLADGLTGSTFRLEFVIAADGPAGQDYGLGGSDADWSVTWSRKGVQQ